ncbi:RNA 2',3'-cyclic phosphodiesterase [Altererythrobacter sp. KTW20L]|uniref:RNA 2',3'-cyclic phosphodiesterase n=1 Tax=Altererythrobacter sp. KTW20L TaxID=2942210 RepID=UPI0020BD4B58|nr:RNA 2',3'-cyclic phosphodiesterase [Altererythrobacter sp. KTW20L]MCL6251740.1 RNA 2',3'-cyclic phosphodiesterase [Altererythrobacter sp. KTW20L]
MLRLFVALRPPPPVIDLLIDTMEGIESARWQDEEQLHLTLAFLGDVDEHSAQDLASALESVAFSPFALAVAGVGHFEHKGRVKAIWAGLSASEALDALRRRVVRACQSAGLEPDHRRFAPHITLARFSHPAPEVPAWLARHARLHSELFTVSHFGLFRSHLSAAGASYEELAQFPHG